jgi:hemolysin activation/secretion protein
VDILFYRIMLLLFLCVVTLPVLSEEIPVIHFNVSAFIIEGENPLTQEETNEILKPYHGEQAGLEGLHAAASALEVALVKAGHSFHRVILPPQTLEAGQVHLTVVVFRLANVEVSGNKFFSDENILRSLPSLQSGTVPRTRLLSKELVLANENTAKEVTLRIKQSKVPDSVDAVVEVQDRKPWSVFSVLNNIGTEETGQYRLSLGYQNSNLLNFDDTLTLSYTTSPDHPGEVKQYGASYRLPLYALSGSVGFYYSRSDVNSGVVQQVFDVSGAGRFVGGQYTQTLFTINNYHHTVSLSVDDKLFQNNIGFLGIPIGVDVRSRPLTLSYAGDYQTEQSRMKFVVSYVHNLGGGGRNNDTSYALARFGAEQNWEALRYGLSYNQALLQNWMVNAVWQGQYSHEPLIPGEQFGLGGVNSVRGFEERAVAGDRGNRISLELWAPPLQSLYNLRVLGFVDAGHTDLLKTLPGEIGSETLVSAGIGLRWYWKEYVSVQFDYGHELNGARTPGAGGTQAYFSIFCRY